MIVRHVDIRIISSIKNRNEQKLHMVQFILYYFRKYEIMHYNVENNQENSKNITEHLFFFHF